ncbi:MAG: hypothetical protein U0271_32120 [Polyangiaceae bacterium]
MSGAKVMVVVSGVISATQVGMLLLELLRPTMDEYLARNGQELAAHLSKARPAAELLATEPLVSEDSVRAPDEKLVVGLSGEGANGANATVIQLEDLEEVGTRGPVYAPVGGSLVSRCEALLYYRTFEWDPAYPKRLWQLSEDEAVKALENCAGLKYIFVIRTVALFRGQLVPMTNSELSAYAKAEVHLFRLEPFEHLGAFLIEAESTRPGNPSSYSEGLLTDELRRALARAGKQRIPNSEWRL